MIRRVRRLGSEPPPVRRVAALGVGLVLIGALAGMVVFYGNSAEEKRDERAAAALRAVRGAYAATTGAESVKVKVEQRAAGSARGQPGSGQLKTGRALLDYANDASSVTVHSPGEGEVRTVTVGRMVYQKVPEQQRKQVPGHKPWMKVDQQKLDRAQYGPAAATARDQPPADPASMLVYLRGATKAKMTGQRANGSPAGNYTARVDLEKAVRGSDPGTRAQAKQLEQQTGKHTLAMRVRLDQQNRVRSLQTTLTAASGGGQAQTQAQRITLREDFYAYDKAGQVRAPAPSKTADVTEQVLRQQQRQRQQQGRRLPTP